MVGTTSIVEGVIAGFLTPIIPKIGGYPMESSLIELHRFISQNAVSVASNLRGLRHGNLALPITAENYMEQMEYSFVPPHNPVDYPPTMGTSQEQALRTEQF